MRRILLKLSGEALAGEKRRDLTRRQCGVWRCR